MSIRRWTTSCCRDSVASSRCRRSSCRRGGPGARSRLGCPRQAADPIDAPIRHRSRGAPTNFFVDGVMVQQPRDDHGGESAEVLCVCPTGRASDRDPEGRQRASGQSHTGQGRQEQGQPALQAGRVRHPLRPRHLARRRLDRYGRGPGLRAQSPGPGTPTTATSSVRGKENARNFLQDNPTWPTSWRSGSGEARHRSARGRTGRRRRASQF